ncbi:hypothetical protein Prum_070380 [Phytohabitans rumicis]|uniref:Uncharacterized protein n=1 Tax=Phytohabitans rumicis TaxID=1076125 RepID=A0A6V8LH24_9ACTN|nr:hypothetical protein Prum_070380 [Phytohabitans rumicis]
MAALRQMADNIAWSTNRQKNFDSRSDVDGYYLHKSTEDYIDVCRPRARSDKLIARSKNTARAPGK